MKILNKIVLASVVTIIAVANAGNDKLDDSKEHAKKSYREAKSGTKSVISDAVITAKVKASLIEEPTLSALNIHVTTKDLCVILKGKVSTTLQKDTAIRLAKKVEGVESVNSFHLEVI